MTGSDGARLSRVIHWLPLALLVGIMVWCWLTWP